MESDTVSIFAIGFAGCFVAIATHITFNSLYSCIFINNRITRSRLLISSFFWLTSIANFVQYLKLGSFGCVFAAKFSVVTFHLQMLSGETFQIYRISVITGRNKLFLAFSVGLIVMRALVAISDLVLSTSAPKEDGTCVFIQELYSGTIHVAMDAIVELFITTAITIALFQHTRELKKLQNKSTSYNLYKIIIETNIFRTVILFLINLFTLFIIMYDPHAIVLTYMWSLMGIVYLYFVIYDKGMVRFLHQIAKGSNSNNLNNSLDFYNQSNKEGGGNSGNNPIMINSTTPINLNPLTEINTSDTEVIFPYMDGSTHTIAEHDLHKMEEIEAFDPPPKNHKNFNNDGFPASIEEWAQYYIGKVDCSDSIRDSFYNTTPNLNLPI
ncbi:hypothetical protein K502DRAFT_286212 [Neoconidiobolus thromboides FSU 785]|nr:hypothetical protein K502DRAFT_286212 [Neoconidiobolus thromboides FSU 785]